MPDTATDLVPVIRSGDFAKLREELVQQRPPELAEALADLQAEDQVIAFRILPRRLAAAVFEYMAPVAQRALIGIVTIDDVLDVAEETATREFQLFGKFEALDGPYLAMSPIQMVKKRAGWLVVLFLGEMLTATAMGFFEKEIARAVVLALFVPLIISSGGNSGCQASTLVIRALAVGELKLTDLVRVIRRELFSGFALGCILGAIGFLRISIWSGLFESVRTALAAGRADGRVFSNRRRAVGLVGGIDTPIHFEAAWL